VEVGIGGQRAQDPVEKGQQIVARDAGNAASVHDGGDTLGQGVGDVRHDLDLVHGDHGRAEERVGRQLVLRGVDRQHGARELAQGVHAVLPRGHVDAAARHLQREVDHAAVPDVHRQVRVFTDHGESGPDAILVQQVARADVPGPLLQHRGRDDHGARQRHARLAQRLERVDHRAKGALLPVHAPPPEDRPVHAERGAVDDLAGKGVVHRARRRLIEMAVEHQAGRVAGRGQFADDVARGIDARLQAGRAHPRRERHGVRALLPGRAGDAHAGLHEADQRGAIRVDAREQVVEFGALHRGLVSCEGQGAARRPAHYLCQFRAPAAARGRGP
jgi:hypothetical protein